MPAAKLLSWRPPQIFGLALIRFDSMSPGPALDAPIAPRRASTRSRTGRPAPAGNFGRCGRCSTGSCARLPSLAELELELGRERRAAAKAARKSRGLPIGRPRKLTVDKIRQAEQLRAGGEPVPSIAATFGVATPTLYRLLAERSTVTASA
jgi:hypothetical protein